MRQFAVFLGRSPDTASRDALRRDQLYLVDQDTSPVLLNAAITGLKFFFDVTADHPELMAKIRPVRVPDTLPVILSREEVSRLIIAAGNHKHQTALALTYATGLRVQQDKGRKARDAMLAPVLLERPRVGWACGMRPRQDTRRRLAVSRARPHQSTQHLSAQPSHPCDRARGPDR